MAQGNYKSGEAIKVTYQAAGNTASLTDVTMKIQDETGALDPVNFPDVTMSEGAVQGKYTGLFTPDAEGVWTVTVNSATKPGPMVRQYDVVGHNVDSVGDAVDSVNTTVGSIDTAVGNLNDVSTAEVNAEVDQALSDYDVAKASDIVSPPQIG